MRTGSSVRSAGSFVLDLARALCCWISTVSFSPSVSSMSGSSPPAATSSPNSRSETGRARAGWAASSGSPGDNPGFHRQQTLALQLFAS